MLDVFKCLYNCTCLSIKCLKNTDCFVSLLFLSLFGFMCFYYCRHNVLLHKYFFNIFIGHLECLIFNILRMFKGVNNVYKLFEIFLLILWNMPFRKTSRISILWLPISTDIRHIINHLLGTLDTLTTSLSIHIYISHGEPNRWRNYQKKIKAVNLNNFYTYSCASVEMFYLLSGRWLECFSKVFDRSGIDWKSHFNIWWILSETASDGNNGQVDIPIFRTEEGRYLASCKLHFYFILFPMPYNLV